MTFMFTRFGFALAALCSLMSGAQAQVAATAPVIEASGLSITKSEFEAMLANDPRWHLAIAKPGGMQTLGTDFGRAFALEAEARKRKIDQDPAVAAKVRHYTQQLLANELLISLRKSYLQDEPLLRAEYAKAQGRYDQPRVRHILVRHQGTEVALRPGRPDLSAEQARSKAQALLVKLKQGADFAALAAAESDDIGTASVGGDMGFVSKGSTVAPFEAAAYALPTGQLSAVVATPFGFHVLRVDQRQPMAFDVVKASIANELAHRKLDDVVLNGYTLNTAYFSR
jgi:peptidyl-prolyl cis-trans isomerase C